VSNVPRPRPRRPGDRRKQCSPRGERVRSGEPDNRDASSHGHPRYGIRH